jgi:anhydro-N-acetylmuramic acid kinase
VTAPRLARSLRVVGLLSGTSVDAIDVAAAEFSYDGGTWLGMRLLGHDEHPWPDGLAQRILAVLPPATTTVGQVCALDNDIGRAFGAAAKAAVVSLTGGRADLVASLGQTVFHDVDLGVDLDVDLDVDLGVERRAGAACRGTLQLGQPAWIAQATGLPVVSDLRAADVAAGGHGAPLASTLDALWLAGGSGVRAALNVGGIANATIVRAPGQPVLALDTGPGNCLLDLAAWQTAGRRFDTGGALAASGRVHAELLRRLRDHPYFTWPAPKSTGREVFNQEYLDAGLAAVGLTFEELSGPDLMATLTELTASTVADALAPHRVTEVIVSGGGARNPTLLAAMRAALPSAEWSTSDDHGLPADAKEAYLVTLLGALHVLALPGTAPAKGGRTATGATHPTILGNLTPALAPGTRPVRALHLASS